MKALDKTPSSKIITKIYADIQKESLWLFTPLFLSIGIYIFFEFKIYLPQISCAGFVFILFAKKMRKALIQIIAIIALGATISNIKTKIFQHDTINHKISNVWLSGKVIRIAHGHKNNKILLGDIFSSRIDNNLDKVQIYTRQNIDKIKISDIVRMRVSLSPIVMHNKQMERFYYFQKINALGYSTSKITIKGSSAKDVLIDFNAIRSSIKSELNKNMKDAQNIAIAKAMIMGEKGQINKEVYKYFRDSGLAHLLAISGIHMAILVTFVFGAACITLRQLFIFKSYIFIQLHEKRISAYLSLVISFCYLIISGCPISAKRAFLMCAMALIAIISNRKICIIKTFSFTMAIILGIYPEELFTPGFGMSFSACGALIAIFSKFQINNLSHSMLAKFSKYFVSIIASSIIASLATAPFSIYYFKSFALYGLIANLLGIPIATFVIMPFFTIAVLLVPLGLSAPFFYIADCGIDILIKIAKYVSIAPYSTITLNAPTDIALYAFFMFIIIFLFAKSKTIKVFSCSLPTMLFLK